MRIALVIASLQGGGAERVAVNLADAWTARGEEVAIITLFECPPAYAIDDRVVLIRAGRARPGERLVLHGLPTTVVRTLRDDAPRLRALRSAIRDFDPDFVISNIDLTNIRTLAAVRGLEYPVFVTEHIDPHFGPDLGSWKEVRRALYREATAVVSMTEHDLRWFDRVCGARCVAIPNPVLRTTRLSRRAVRTKRNVAAVGRLDPQKGFDRLLHAFALVADAQPDWTLTIWGEGPLRGWLESIAAGLGIASRIHLPGFTRDIDTALAEVDLFALPSRFEAFPNSLCEAMARGIAPIAFDCAPGVRSIIRDRVDGRLVEADDVLAFAATMGELMADDAQRERLAARAAEVSERFSVQRVLAAWDSLFAETSVRPGAAA
jgi:GalNAc-alpha-(1->4)-GalNAc-alpha-(1->3)-diNAcBac-PP-undecaprenol alpha-1,4-N-acetyl-D-galactosaminyltransferase